MVFYLRRCGSVHELLGDASGDRARLAAGDVAAIQADDGTDAHEARREEELVGVAEGEDAQLSLADGETERAERFDRAGARHAFTGAVRDRGGERGAP